jgi:hypothetical protein
MRMLGNLPVGRVFERLITFLASVPGGAKSIRKIPSRPESIETVETASSIWWVQLLLTRPVERVSPTNGNNRLKG